MLEVCIFTALLGLGMQAFERAAYSRQRGQRFWSPWGPRLTVKYMGQTFVGGALGHAAGTIAGVCVSVVFGGLLLSAVNTAIVDLIAISYLMSRDGELPRRFESLVFRSPNPRVSCSLDYPEPFW